LLIAPFEFKTEEYSMIPMKSIVFAALMLLAAPVFAQDAAVAAAPDVPEIAPAPVAKGDCAKCKQGGKMARGDMGGMQQGGMSRCKGKQDGAATEGCEKCKQGGMGRMAHGDMEGMQHGGMGGMGCCGGKMVHGGGMQHGGAGDTAALERRINELEKRLDLMQQLLQQLRKTR
jgi:hypothetical protein